MPKLVMFCGREINYLGNEVLVHKSAYLSPMGWPGIYNICFSRLDGDKDSPLLDGGFSFLIDVRLIRNNWKAVIGNYPTSLIGETRFGLQDKLFNVNYPVFLAGEI